MGEEIAVTPSLQNYIEVLFELNQSEVQVRVTDLARRLSVAKSSVNQAIRQLVKLGLALHERYGRVELTERGLVYARELEKRHAILETFFSDVLHVDRKTASRDACIIEHVISPVTIAKLTEYLTAHETLACRLPTSDCGQPTSDCGQPASGCGQPASGCGQPTSDCGQPTSDCVQPTPACRRMEERIPQLTTLWHLRAGLRARVVRVTARGALHKRMLDMGLTAGAGIVVRKVAPLGDPIEITVKGYQLALRREEADEVIVEILPDEDVGH